MNDEAQELIARRILEPIKAKAQSMNIQVDTLHIDRGRVSTALTAAADELGCGVIVMSSHGRTGVLRAMLGSEASAVAASAKVPVLITR